MLCMQMWRIPQYQVGVHVFRSACEPATHMHAKSLASHALDMNVASVLWQCQTLPHLLKQHASHHSASIAPDGPGATHR